MARPTSYDKTTNFSQYALNNPNSKYNAPDHDKEFANIETALDETQAVLNGITRDDGVLANRSVHPQALDPQAMMTVGGSWTPKGFWSATTLYVPGDVVERMGGISYVCSYEHVSNDFAVEKGLGHWVSMGNGSDAAVDDVEFYANSAYQSYVDAQTQAGIAATQAGNAQTSATNASNSATAASNSATAAASSYDSFDDRYLGPKSSAPSVDNDGNTLLVGALYFDTTANAMYVWTGSAWVLPAPAPGTVFAYTQNFSGNNSTTQFTLSPAPATPILVNVFISGVRQYPTADYSLSGAVLTFTSAPPTGTNNIFVQWTTPVSEVQSISTGMINDGAVTTAKLNAQVINAATEDTSPDLANDFLLSYDASATANKKVKMQTLGFPSGTRMTFNQTAAPTGWTKDTTHDNKALRLVSGTVGSGGTTAFTSVFASRTPAGSVSVTAAGTISGTTLSAAQSGVPAHTHTFVAGGVSSGAMGVVGIDWTNSTLSTNANTAASASASHNHTFTNSGSTGSFTGTAMDFAVQYVDLIIAQKN